MIHKTILLPVEKAAILQQRAEEFGCTFLNVAVSSNNSARVSISGPDDKMVELFELIGEHIDGSEEN